MADIHRNVIIKPAIMKGKDIIIKGNQGGEMIFSLSKPSPEGTDHRRDKRRTLIVSCYRTKRLGYVDVSEYNGNKGEIIRVIVNNEKKFMSAKPVLYLFNPDNRIIEYGTLKRMNGFRIYDMFYYKTIVSHEFKEVKIVCFENLCL